MAKRRRQQQLTDAQKADVEAFVESCRDYETRYRMRLSREGVERQLHQVQASEEEADAVLRIMFPRGS